LTRLASLEPAVNSRKQQTNS